MNIGEKIRQARKEKCISQEGLAERLGLTVQAVSKWECSLSCPDIALLPSIADFLEVSLDYLLRNDPNDMGAEKTAQLNLPDDDVLRIIQCIGRKIISKDEWKQSKQDEKIPLHFDEAWKNRKDELQINIEIWGAADIEGAISGNATAGGNINCDSIGNNATAGNIINCDSVGNDVNAGSGVNCGNVGNDVNAGSGVNCGSVGNDVNAGSVVNCDSVGNDVNAGNSVTCGDIHGNVYCEGEIHCKTIEGDVTGGSIFMEN